MAWAHKSNKELQQDCEIGELSGDSKNMNVAFSHQSRHLSRENWGGSWRIFSPSLIGKTLWEPLKVSIRTLKPPRAPIIQNGQHRSVSIGKDRRLTGYSRLLREPRATGSSSPTGGPRGARGVNLGSRGSLGPLHPRQLRWITRWTNLCLPTFPSSFFPTHRNNFVK